jgi:hypothetical protein
MKLSQHKLCSSAFSIVATTLFAAGLIASCKTTGRDSEFSGSTLSDKTLHQSASPHIYIDEPSKLMFRIAAFDVESIDQAKQSCAEMAASTAPYDWKLIETPKHVVFMGDDYLTQYGSRKIVRGIDSLCGRLVRGDQIKGLTEYRLEESTGNIQSARVLFADDGDKYGSQIVATFEDGFVCKVDWVFQAERLVKIENTELVRNRNIPVGDALCVSESAHPNGYRPRSSSPTTDPTDIIARQDFERKKSKLLEDNATCEANCNRGYSAIIEKGSAATYLEIRRAANEFEQCILSCRRAFDEAAKQAFPGR